MSSVKRRKFSEDHYFKLSQEKLERSSNSTISFKAAKSHQKADDCKARKQ